MSPRAQGILTGDPATKDQRDKARISRAAPVSVLLCAVDSAADAFDAAFLQEAVQRHATVHKRAQTEHKP
jgi:hypothetical protein